VQPLLGAWSVSAVPDSSDLSTATMRSRRLADFVICGRRAREIGVRMSLGARRSDILRMVVRENLRLSVPGLSTGLVISAAGAFLLASFLFASLRSTRQHSREALQSSALLAPRASYHRCLERLPRFLSRMAASIWQVRSSAWKRDSPPLSSIESSWTMTPSGHQDADCCVVRRNE
jgi:ABC-type antimicrobial peptide transport system permease subunit